MADLPGQTGTRRLAYPLVLVALALALSAAAAPAGAASHNVTLDCVDDAGGAAYETETGLVVFEDDADVRFGTVTGNATLAFDGGNLTASAQDDATARLEDAGPVTCLGNVDASTAAITVTPADAQTVTIAGNLSGLAFGSVAYDGTGADFAYNASERVTLTFASTGLTDGTGVTAIAVESDDVLTKETVGADGSVTVSLPATSGAQQITLVESSRLGEPTLGVGDEGGPETVPAPANGSRTVAVTLSNNGTEAHNLTDFDVSGPNASSFTVVAPAAPVTVPGGESQQITVRVAPDTPGPKNATLSVSTDNLGQPSVEIPLSAAGIEPTATLSLGQATAERNVTAAVGGSATTTLSVTNDGTLGWNVTDLTVTGPDADAFTVVGPATPATVAGGGSQSVTVRFAPDSTGVKNATLTLGTANPAQPTVERSLTATARRSPVSFSQSTVELGGTRSVETTLSLTNDLDEQVGIERVAITGADADQFAVETTETFNLSAGATRPLNVSFDPVAGKTSSATLVVEPDGDRQPVTVSLSGTGGTPNASVSVDTVTFDGIDVGADAVQRVAVTNDGTGPLRLDQSTITGPDADAFSLTNDTDALVVPAGETRRVGIRYQSSAESRQNATLTLAGPLAETTLSLTGQPAFSRAETNVSSLQFGTQNVSESTTRTLEVQNPASATQNLGIEAVSITGNNADEFTASVDDPSLSPGQSATVDVTLRPDSPGTKSGILKVVTNSTIDPQLDVWLSNTRSVIVVQPLDDEESTGPEDDGSNQSVGDANGTDSAVNDSNAATSDVPTIQVRGRNIPNASRISVNVSQPSTRRSDAALDVVTTTLERGGNFSVNISHTGQPGSGVPSFESTSANESLRYVEIAHTFANENVSNNTFLTRVSKARLKRLDADPGTVSMSRYHDGEWRRLPASEVAETRTHHIYRVQTPGFSSFAVSAPVARLSLQSVSLNRTGVRVGQAVAVTATVTNNGTAGGTYTASLGVNGSVTATRNVSVAPGGTETVTFVTRQSGSGRYALAVDGTEAGVVTVTPQTNETNESDDPDAGGTLTATPSDDGGNTDGNATQTATPSDQDGGGSLLLVGGLVVVLVVGIVLGFWYWNRDDETEDPEASGEAGATAADGASGNPEDDETADGSASTADATDEESA